MQNPQPHAVVDLHGGGEPWLCKTTIRRSVLMRLFGEAYDLRGAAFSLTL